MLSDRVAALREANIYERQRYRHIVGMPALRSGEATAMRRETPFLVVRTMRDGTHGPVRHRPLPRSQCVHDGGRLRFAERIVVCDSSRIDTLLAIPL